MRDIVRATGILRFTGFCGPWGYTVAVVTVSESRNVKLALANFDVLKGMKKIARFVPGYFQ